MPRLTRILGILVFTASILAAPQQAAAQGETGNVCVRDYQGGATCTANDVRIEALTVISVVEDCVSGTPGETEVVFETLISSAGSPDRYDIGFFLALDGGSARDGDSCYHDYLDPPLTTTPTYGDKNSDTIDDITDGPWWDDDTDTCGDIESNTQLFKTLPALRFACIDTNADGSADVSVCTSWDNNSNTACNSVAGAFPGTNSKCSCAGVELGIAPEPAITIVKSPANQNVLAGGTANFTFTVTSKTTISNVVVSDPDCDAAPAFTGGDTNNDSILTPDETWTYTCSKAGVMADFTNTVTVTGDAPNPADGGMTTVMVNDTDSANVTVSAATMTLAKSGVLNDGGDGVVDAGDSIAYTFTVTNTGSVALTSVAVTDPLPGLSAITCPSGNPIPMLAVAASENCTATLVLSQAAVDSGQIDNTATANSNEVGPVQDSESIPLPAMPALTLVKTGTLNDGGDGVADAGDTIDYTFQVTNTGNVTITAIGVSDPMIAPITCAGGNPIPSLAPGASVNCTGSYTLLQADVDAGMKDNTADATGQDPGGNPVSDMDSHSEPLPAAPALTLVKAGTFNDESGDGTAQAGETISYTFTVTNTGNVTLSNVAVTDPMVSPITCPSGNPIPSLAPGASEICTGSYAVVQADVDAGQKDNTATAAGEDPGGSPVSDMDTASTPLPGAASLSLTKTGTFNDESGDGVAQAGETISYSFQVTNTGSVVLTNVAVADPMVSPITCPSGNPIPSLAVAASETCTGTYTLTQADVDAGQKDNTASADSDQAGPVMDSESVLLPAAPALTLVKSGTFNDESGDGTAQAGETISYTFTVTNTGNQTLSNVAVTDPMVSPITCPSGNPIPTLAPAAGEVCTGSYTVVQADVDAGQKDNTATAAGEDPGGSPVSDMDTASTPLAGAPAVGAVKSSQLAADNDSSGALSPGDDLLYTLVITNAGAADALDVILTDVPDPNTALRVGTVTTTQGAVAVGNVAGDADVTVDIGTLAAGGGQATVTFEVRIDDPLAAGVTEIVNQGIVSASNFPNAFTDDPSTAPADDPTSDPIVGGGAPIADIPTLSEWGFLLFVLLLSAGAMAILRRRSVP